MEEGNLAILVDAKTEYTKQLVNCLKYNLYLSFSKLFLTSKQRCENENRPNMVLNIFQELLREVPNWNQDRINSEYELIVKTSKCDWLEELITAVIISHTRILTSINFNKNKSKINLKIPKTTHFVHKCFIDVARYFWKNAYLFDDRVNNYEIQKNRRETEVIIEQSINETIRKELPVKHILKEYLGDEYKEDKLSIDETESTQNNINLRNMVMKEIQSCTNEQLNLINKKNEENEIGTPEPTPTPAPVQKPIPEPEPEPSQELISKSKLSGEKLDLNLQENEINIIDKYHPVKVHEILPTLSPQIEKIPVEIKSQIQPTINDLNIEELKLEKLEPINFATSPELQKCTIKTEEPLNNTDNSVKTILINTTSKNEQKKLTDQNPVLQNNENDKLVSDNITKKDFTFF